MSAERWDWWGSKAQDWAKRVQAELGIAQSGITPKAPTTEPDGLWHPNTAYPMGAQIANAGYPYTVVQPGMSAATGTGPSGGDGYTPIQDGTVYWMAMQPSQQSDPYASGGGDSGGGGGGGGGEEGGGGGGGGDYEEEPAPEAAEDPFADEGSSELPEDGGYAAEQQVDPFDTEGSFSSEETYDPFAQEDDSELYEEPTTIDEETYDPSTEESTDLEEMLGQDFKVEYLFMPHQAISDAADENEKRGWGTGAPGGLVTPAGMNPKKQDLSPAQQARLNRALQKLAAARSRRLSQGEAFVMDEYTIAPGETLADRLNVTKSAWGTPYAEGETVAGEDILHDVNDILIDSWGTDITDEPADPTRRTASLHHGAAYLEERVYPRGGASSGQEGGIMFPRVTINTGARIVASDLHPNVDDYDHGADVLGGGAPVTATRARVQAAKKPRAQFFARKTPGGNKITSLVTTKGRTPKQTLKNAKDVAKRAFSIGSKLKAAVAKGKMKKPGAPVTKVRGDEDTLFGAVRKALGVAAPSRKSVATRGGVRPYQRMSPAQAMKIAEKTIKAAKGLQTHAGTFTKQLGAGAKRKAAAAGAARKLIAFTKGKTKVRGEDVLGEDPMEGVDLCHEAASTLMYGALEDTYAEELVNSAYADALLDVVEGNVVTYSEPTPIGPGGGAPPSAGYEDAYVEDPLDACGPMPTIETMEAPAYVAAPAGANDTDYKALPGGVDGGAIVFDGSRMPATKSMGSASYFKDGQGIVWQSDGGTGHWNGNINNWYGTIDDWGRESVGITKSTPKSDQGKRWMKQNGIVPRPDATYAEMNAISIASGWGPIIGNPADADFKNLHVDSGGNQLFWFYDQAPQWAKDPSQQEQLAKAITDWKACVVTAQADQAARAIQDQLDAEEAAAITKQQAKEDVALEHQISLDRKKSEQDAEVQAKADEAYSRQQQTADDSSNRLADAQMESEIKARQAEAEIERAQQQQDFEQYQALRAPTGDDGAEFEEAAAFEEGATMEEGVSVPGGMIDLEQEGVEAEDLPTENTQSSEGPDTGEYNFEDEI